MQIARPTRQTAERRAVALGRDERRPTPDGLHPGASGSRRRWWATLAPTLFFGGNNRPAEQDVDMLDSSIDGQELVDRWAGFDPIFFVVAVHDRIRSGSGLDGFLGSLDRQGCEPGNGPGGQPKWYRARLLLARTPCTGVERTTSCLMADALRGKARASAVFFLFV
jgi:hypothetical protein